MVVNSIKLFWYNETTAIMYNQLQVNFTWLIDKCYRNKKKLKKVRELLSHDLKLIQKHTARMTSGWNH